MTVERHGAREAAALALFSIHEEGAWSAQAVDRYAKHLSPRDTALATALVGGVLQHQAMCDWYLTKFSHTRLKKIEPRILDLMRLAVYQMVWMDRIPNSAAINESVELARRLCRGRKQTIGFVNAVLRSVDRQCDDLPRPDCPTKEEYYALEFSHPLWLSTLLCEEYGYKQARLMMQANNQPAPTVLRVNTLRAQTEDVLRALLEAGIRAELHESIPNCITCTGTGSLRELALFQSGAVTVQDGASQMSIWALNPQPGSVMIDCCSAPGGKSFFAAERMNNTGAIRSCDIFDHKLNKIREGAERLGLSILHPALQDASEFVPEWEASADYVLCDVPCSGLGIIRKKPEIRYKDPAELEQLPELQYAILENCARYVKNGGTLVYSTCTVLRRENQEIVKRFQKAHPEFELCSFSLPVCEEKVDGMITLLPHIHKTDGFFVAKFRKMPYYQ